MDKLLVVDGNSVLYRGFYALPPLTTKEGLFTNAVYGFCNVLIRVLKEVEPTHLVVAFDYGKKTFRNELYSEYKITRKETPAELVMQFPIIKEVLDSMNVKYIEMEGFEGDDIIGSISKKFSDVQTIVLTGDQDTLQLIDDTTTIYLTKRGSDIKVFDEKVLLEERGITPSQVVDVKSIMGDVSDNIPGVKGIGEKGAYSLIIEYGSLENVYSNLDKLTKGQQSKLIESKEDAFLSHKLGTIKTDIELKYDLEEFSFKMPFPRAFHAKCKKYEFTTIQKNEALFENLAIQENLFSEFLVETDEQLKKTIETLSNEKKIALDFSNEIFECCVKEKEIIKFNIDNQKVFNSLKSLFENSKITKYVFDLKRFKTMLLEHSMDSQFVSFEDVALMTYLLTANDKSVEIEDFCEKYSTNNLCDAIFESINNTTQEIKDKGLEKLYREVELPLVDVLLEMEVNGIKLDKERLLELNQKVKREIASITNEIFLILGYEINLNSPKQLAEALFDDLKIFIPDNKKRSTSGEVLQKVENVPIISLILKYRRLVKMQSSYLEAYLDCEKNGFIHTHFLQMVTGTGRLSSKDPNMQNLPIQDSESKLVREVFIPRFENGYLMSFDYEQIELKLMAHFSGDETMITAFNNRQDIHKTVASKLFRVPLDEVTPEQRRRAKAVNFGIIYGQSAFGLGNSLNVSMSYAQNFIDNYFATFPKVKQYMEASIKKAKENDFTAVTLLGRRRKLVEMQSSNYQLRSFGERVAINMPLQGSASDIIKLAMVRIFNELRMRNLKSKLVLQVHDELVFDVCEDEMEDISNIVKKEMENVIPLSVPLTISIQKGKTLSKD